MREFDEKNKVPSVSLQFSSQAFVTTGTLWNLHWKMTEKESATQRKIIEVRRKISLCEGKRRAVYNLGEVLPIRWKRYDWFLFTLLLVDKEKKKNKEDTLQIVEEVKVNYWNIYLQDWTKNKPIIITELQTVPPVQPFYKRILTQKGSQSASLG